MSVFFWIFKFICFLGDLEVEAYLEPNSFQLLTILAKKLHRRCSIWLQIRLSGYCSKISKSFIGFQTLNSLVKVKALCFVERLASEIITQCIFSEILIWQLQNFTIQRQFEQSQKNIKLASISFCPNCKLIILFQRKFVLEIKVIGSIRANYLSGQILVQICK